MAITLSEYSLQIGGEQREARHAATFDVANPANQEAFATVSNASAEDVQAAIDAAAAAQPGWAGRPAPERAAIMRRAYELMVERRDDIARTLTRENGKPMAEARAEVTFAADYVLWFAEEARRVMGEIIPASTPAKRLLTFRQPVGVCAAITPWNFPASMITRKVAPAIAAGCAVVLRPASATPLSALEIGRCFAEAGLPGGVLNVVPSDRSRQFSEVIFSDARVRRVSFTGSTEVGKELIAASARNVVGLSLELGGHAPFIVFEDADMEAAVAGAMVAKMRNAGQTCVASNRFYVHSGVAAEFSRRLAAEMEKLKVGNGLDEGVQAGPLINASAMEKVRQQVADATSRGAELLTGGSGYADGSLARGYFFQPTVLANVDERMAIATEETFGPVAPIFRFESEDEAIARANALPYGLAAYFYTRDVSRVFRVAERLQFGVIGANDGLPATAQAPFGGVKESGIGREGGHHGMDEYLETKYVSLGIRP
ncbi:MAG: NAD-dependent succinate-semialdehyde dehydrogenase [Chloroflexota bacterium]